MGIKTVVNGLSYATNHLNSAAKAAQDVNSLHREVLQQITELTNTLTLLKGSMVTGDGNIATIAAQITALN